MAASNRLIHPGIWNEVTLRDKQKAFDFGPNLNADPLSKAIIIEEVLEIMRLRPDWTFREILDRVPPQAVSDSSLARKLSLLACSLRSERKNDSSSG